MATTIKNYTGREITFITKGRQLVVLPVDGRAYVGIADEAVGDYREIPMYRPVYGEVVGLPDPEQDTLYVVTTPIRNALRGRRTDLVIPVKTWRHDGKHGYYALEVSPT